MIVQPPAPVIGNAELAALLDAEIVQLASEAQALRALLVENAVVTARVLASNGLTDLLEIAGRRVAASLPPTVRPGDVLAVQVTGFDGDRILLQIVGTAGDAAAESATRSFAPPPLPAAPPMPTVPPIPAAQAANAPAWIAVAHTAAPNPAPEPTIAAPQPAIATALAVEELPVAAPPVPPPSPEFAAAVLRANVAPLLPRGPETAAPRGPALVAPERTSIEARMATARATVAGANTSLSSILSMRTTAPRPVLQPAVINAAQIVTRTLGPRASGLSAYTEPVALLRALRLPVTASNVAAAQTALERPERLSSALAALERALPVAPEDPQIATLRTLLAFVGRIDPRSPVLATQIAAYVDHVVDGTEPKLVTLLAALRAAAPSDPAPATSTATPATAVTMPAPATPTTATPTMPTASAQTVPSPTPAVTTVPRTVPAAVAVERAAAVSVDLKQTLVNVAVDPATPAAAGPALAGALTALTAVQLNAAQALAANPNGIAFTLPLVTEHGAATARISVQRDVERERGAPVDPANFRIAFVLDTAHCGTVAIDLVTVGREVTVDVRTEAAPAMRAFRDALGGLTARLESLRYHVASAGASVGTTSTIAIDTPPSRPVDPDAMLDRSA